MEVVLLEDVKALGKKGQIVKVNDGYARNFILPKKLGVEATSKNLKRLKTSEGQRREDRCGAASGGKGAGCGPGGETSITVSIKAGEGGKAFGSVSSKEIAKAIQGAAWRWKLIKRKWCFRNRLRRSGTFEVPIKLHRDVTAKLAVKVVEAKNPAEKRKF